MTTDLALAPKTIKVIDLLNPLDLENIQTRYEEWSETKPLIDYVPADGEFIVSVSGGIVPVSEWEFLIPAEDDTIVLVPVLEGGGGNGAKNVLRLVAFVALMAFTGGQAAWALPQLLGAAGITGTAATLITAGVQIAGAMLINTLLPVQPSGSSGMDDSPSYGSAFPSNTSAEGVAVPVVYGKHRMAGNYIAFATENAEKTQIFYGLVNAGEGPIAGISDIQIQDQPIENFTDVATEIRTGTGDQQPIRWFADTMTPLGVGVQLPSSPSLGRNQQWITRITNRPVDKLRVDMLAPEGVAWITDKGELRLYGTWFHVRYRRVNQDGTPIPGEPWQGAMRLGSGVGEGVDSFLITPPRAGGGGGGGGGAGGGFNPPFEPVIPAAQKAYFDGVNPLTGELTPNFPAAQSWSSLPEGFEQRGSVVVAAGTNSVLGVAVRGIVDSGMGPRRVGDPVGTFANLEIRGTTRQPLRQTYVTPEIPFGYYEVQVRRADQEYPREDKAVDALMWESLVQIVSDDVAYRHTALLGLRIRFNDQLNSTPSINFLHHGVLVRQIDNTGNWAMGSSENPAWACLDMLTNPRYGARVPLWQVDMDSFVQWAKYCEAKNLEFNMVVDQSITIWDALKYVCRVGRAQVVRTGTKFSVILEAESSPVMMFSEQNIVKGSFAMSWLPLAERANSVEVTYWDAAKNYERATVKIVDPDIIEGMSERVAKVTMYGVTSRNQALQEANLQININKYLTRTVSFEASLDALACTVGSVVLVKHVAADFQNSGRFMDAPPNSGQLILDRPVTLTPGHVNKLLVHEPLYRAAQFGTVQSVNASTGAITVSGLQVLATPGAPAWNRATTAEIVSGGVTRQFSISQIVGSGGFSTIYVEPNHLSDLTGLGAGGTVNLYIQDAVIEMTVLGASPHGDSKTLLTLSGANTLALSGSGHWMLGPEVSLKKQYRILSIEAGSEPTTRKLSAVEYDARVYQSLNILPNPDFSRPSQPFNGTISHVRNLQGRQRVLYEGGGKAEFWMDMNWELPGVGQYNGALIFIRNTRDNSWQPAGRVDGDGMNFNVKAPENFGVYEIAVLAKDPQNYSPPLSSAPKILWDLYSEFESVLPENVVATPKVGFNAITWESEFPFKVDRAVIAAMHIPDLPEPPEGWPAPPAGGWPENEAPWENDPTGSVSLAAPFIYAEWLSEQERLGNIVTPATTPAFHRAKILEAGAAFAFEDTSIELTGRYRYWVAFYDKAQPNVRSAWVRSNLIRVVDVSQIIDADAIQSAILADVQAEIDRINAEVTADLGALNTRVTSLNATVLELADLAEDVDAKIVNEENARSAADNALASQINAAVARIANAESLVASESSARVTADESFASQLNSLDSRLDTAEQGVAANAAAASSLTTRVAAAEGELSSQGNQITALQNNLTDLGGSVAATNTAVSNLTSRVTSVEGELSSQGASITQLNSQISSRAQVHFQPTPPAGSAHAVNDLWFDTDDGNRPYFWNGMAWVIAEDGRWGQRNRVFAQASIPGGDLNVGDLWIDTDDGNRMYRWDGGSWVPVDDSRIAATASGLSALTTRVNTVEGQITSQSSQITQLQNSVSQRNRVFAQPDAPAAALGLVDGDLWIDTNDDNRLHRWSSGSWLDASDVRFAERNRVFAQPTPPSEAQLNDIWMDTDDNNRLYRWDGGNWIDSADARIDANSSAISGLQSRVTATETGITSISSQITSLSNSVNQRARIYAQNTAPTPPLNVNDLWIDTTSGSNRLSRWNGSTWTPSDDARFNQRSRVFVQGTAPTGTFNVDDLWFNSSASNAPHRWNGSAWVSIEDPRTSANASAITTLNSQVTTINGQLSSQASQITTLTSQTNSNTATIQSQATTLNGLLATASLTLDVNGRITGYRLVNNGSTSTFDIIADRFRIASPAGGVAPFALDGNQVFIQDAYIRNLAVDKLTSGNLNADIIFGTGRIVLQTATHMKVSGTGFGVGGEFIEWFGPRMDISLCSRSNGISYVTRGGDAYFGGALSAGTLYNAATSTDKSTGFPQLTLGPFGTGGQPKTVVASFTFSAAQSRLPSPPSRTTGTIVIAIFRRIGSFAETEVGRLTINTTATFYFEPEPGFEGWYVGEFGSGSITLTDSDPSLLDRTFRAQVITNTSVLTVGNAEQRLSLISTEQGGLSSGGGGGAGTLDPAGNYTMTGSWTFNGRTAITPLDTRSTNSNPGAVGRALIHDFKSNAAIGVPGGGFSFLSTYSPWSDDSGGGDHQLAFSQNNSGRIHYRYGTRSGGWGTWREIFHTGNLTPVRTVNGLAPDANGNVTVSGGGGSATIPERLGATARIISNWDDAIENGWYQGNSASNSPEGGWMMGEVIAHNSLWITQTVQNFTQGARATVWRRNRLNGSWQAWQAELPVASSTTFAPSNSNVQNAAASVAGSFGGGVVMRDVSGWGGMWMAGGEVQFGTGNSGGLATRARLDSSSNFLIGGSLFVGDANNSANVRRQARIFVQSGDPGFAAQDGDLWIW